MRGRPSLCPHWAFCLLSEANSNAPRHQPVCFRGQLAGPCARANWTRPRLFSLVAAKFWVRDSVPQGEERLACFRSSVVYPETSRHTARAPHPSLRCDRSTSVSFLSTHPASFRSGPKASTNELWDETKPCHRREVAETSETETLVGVAVAYAVSRRATHLG